MEQTLNIKEEKEPLLRAHTCTQPSSGYPAVDNCGSGVADTEIECDAGYNGAQTIWHRADFVGGEYHSPCRTSLASNCDISSQWSGSKISMRNLTDQNGASSMATIYSGPSRWIFWSTIITFTISSLAAGMAVSTLVPFYTAEAKQRGITVAQSGLVNMHCNIRISNITICCTLPICHRVF